MGGVLCCYPDDAICTTILWALVVVAVAAATIAILGIF